MPPPPPSQHRPLPLRALLQANLQAQATLLPQLLALVALLSSPSSSAASARTASALARASSQLAALDADLALLTERARKHAEKWETLEALKRACVAVEQDVRRRALRLERGRRELGTAVDEARGQIKAIQLARARTSCPARASAPPPPAATDSPHPLPLGASLPRLSSPDPLAPADLLAYASTLGPYTSAPPSFDPATTAAAPGHPGAFFPPFPTEHAMRRGRLNADADAGAAGGLGVVGQTSAGTSAPPSLLSLLRLPDPP